MSSDPLSADAWAEFRKAMEAQGVATRDKISPDAKLQRFHIEGQRKGTKNGWLTFHGDHPASGAFGDYKNGVNETWTVTNPERMTDEERADLKRRMADTRRQRAEEIAAAHAMCQVAAATILAACERADPAHPYIKRKGIIAPPGLKQLARDVKYDVADLERPNRTARAGVLVIPIMAPDKTLWSVQTIDGEGRKHFLFGTNKKGHYWSIGKLTPRIIIGEGFSTMTSVHMATGCCCVIAFDANNLEAVARAIRKKYPDHEIVIAADNDRFTTKPVPNPGMTRACEAAAAVNGLVAWPEFEDGATLENGDLPTDFNDLAAIRGNTESVAAAFEAATAPADIENHVDPRRPSPAPDEMPPPALPTAENPTSGQPIIPDAAVLALRRQGFDWGSEVEVAGAFRDVIGRGLGSLIHAEGQFWTFCATHWRPIDRDALRRAIHLLDGAEIDGGGRTSKVLKLGSRMVDGIIKELGIMVGDAEFFSDPKPGIPARNCLVTFAPDGRVRTEKHHPDHRRRFVVDADFDVLQSPSEPPTGTLLYRLLNGAFADDLDKADKIALISEALGAAAAGLATRVAQPKALILYGVTAENGKSSIADLFSALLPRSAVCSISPRDMGDKAIVVGLVGAAANVLDELGGASLAGESFKAAVTGNPMTGRDLYKSATTFRPRALHVLTTNQLPHFNGGLDRGLQRRIVVVEFRRPIPASEMVPEISGRIASEELETLLGFAVTGASRLVRRGSYTVPSTSRIAMDGWVRDEPLAEWAAERLIACSTEPPGGWPYSIRDLRSDFVQWSVTEGYREADVPKPNIFTKSLRKVPGVLDVSRRADGARVIGVRLKVASTAGERSRVG